MILNLDGEHPYTTVIQLNERGKLWDEERMDQAGNLWSKISTILRALCKHDSKIEIEFIYITM